MIYNSSIILNELRSVVSSSSPNPENMLAVDKPTAITILKACKRLSPSNADDLLSKDIKETAFLSRMVLENTKTAYPILKQNFAILLEKASKDQEATRTKVQWLVMHRVIPPVKLAAYKKKYTQAQRAKHTKIYNAEMGKKPKKKLAKASVVAKTVKTTPQEVISKMLAAYSVNSGVKTFEKEKLVAVCVPPNSLLMNVLEVVESATGKFCTPVNPPEWAALGNVAGPQQVALWFSLSDFTNSKI